MRYPNFLKDGDKAFFVAPSNPTSDGPIFRRANQFFERQGLEPEFDETIFGKGLAVGSDTGLNRAKRFTNFWKRQEQALLLAVAGGEFEMEVLPHLKSKDFEGEPKWFVGFSDNTILHHYLLTHCNVASVYHYNIKYFGMKKMHDSVKDSIRLLKGQKSIFYSYKKFQQGFPVVNQEGDLIKFEFNTKSYLTTLTEKNDCQFSGRMIGGCLDILRVFFGTKFDKTKQFLEKYKTDGFVWYLEDYNMDACELKRVLWQMEQNGWFKYVKGFVFGRSLTRKAYGNYTHEDAIKEVLSKFGVPIVWGADVGHVFPIIPVISGALGDITYKKGKLKIEYKFV